MENQKSNCKQRSNISKNPVQREKDMVNGGKVEIESQCDIFCLLMLQHF